MLALDCFIIINFVLPKFQIRGKERFYMKQKNQANPVIKKHCPAARIRDDRLSFLMHLLFCWLAQQLEISVVLHSYTTVMGCLLISHFTARNIYLPVNYFTEVVPEREIKQSKTRTIHHICMETIDIIKQVQNNISQKY